MFLPGETLGTSSIPPLGVKPSDAELDALYGGLPHQPMHIAAVLTGHDSPVAAAHTPRAYDWADALDVAKLVSDVLGVEVVVSQGAHQAFHPGRTAALSLRNGTPVGYAGELHPKLLAELDLPERTVAMEIDADTLFEASADVIVAKEISTFPISTEDVALVVDSSVVAADVLETLREGAGESARRHRALRRVLGHRYRGRQEVAGLRPALPRRGPHPDRRRGLGGACRRRGPGRRAIRGGAALGSTGLDPRRGPARLRHCGGGGRPPRP